MNKSALTRIKIEEALSRILQGKPTVVSPTQKLSIKAVEEEAGLGSGAIYYYKDIVNKIKENHLKSGGNTKKTNLYEEKILNLRERLNKEIKLKEKYRIQAEDLKQQLSAMAGQHNQLALTIQQYQYKIIELQHTLPFKKDNE